MANLYSAVHDRYLPKITSGDTLYLTVFLADSATPTAGKTGIAFGSVTATYAKAGGTSLSAWPTDSAVGWETGNWREIGGGFYEVIIQGSQANELALLDTVGSWRLNLAATGCVQCPINRTVTSGPPAQTDLAVTGATLAADQAVNVTKIGGQAATAPAGVAFPAAVGTSTYAGADTAGTTTILGKLAGITLLANWLRAFGRKDTADTTAKTEINATGGTYNEATDSLEAATDVIRAANTTQIGGQAASAAAPVAFPAAVGTSVFAGGAVASVAGDVGGNVNGKVLGGGAGVMSAAGVRAVDATGAAIAPAATALDKTVWTDAKAAFLDAAVSTRGTSDYAGGAAVPGDAMTLTTAYDAAKSAAAPGAKMDLVDAPSATGLAAVVAAIWNALVAGFTTPASIGAKLLGWTPGGAVASVTDKSGFAPSADDVAAKILATPANKLVTDSSGRVTVGSNADKDGYALTTDQVTAIRSGLSTLAAGAEMALTSDQVTALVASFLEATLADSAEVPDTVAEAVKLIRQFCLGKLVSTVATNVTEIMDTDGSTPLVTHSEIQAGDGSTITRETTYGE